jgi:hypothetical protein
MLGLTITALITTAILNGANPNAQLGFYAQSTVVSEVKDDVVTITDANGNDWQFNGAEDWLEGDVCTITFCDNGTETIYDDVIVNTKYDGYIY